MPFWRREPVHRRLAREGGLGTPPPHDPGPHWGEVGIHGIPRPREWDATAVAEAPGLEDDEVELVALPDGTLLVEADGDATPLAEAVEMTLAPPYRARAFRRAGARFAVGANRIRVAELPPHVEGDSLRLTVTAAGTTFVVDDRPGFGTIPQLQWLAGDAEEYVLEAERLDGAFWEIRLLPL